MKTILVVDDEYALAETLQEFLEEEGFGVLTAKNGAEALELVNQQRPDLMLMDIMMPILGGVETLQRIRENEKEELRALPVILMSSVPKKSIDPTALAMASSFLRKPFRLPLLIEAIRKVIGG